MKTSAVWIAVVRWSARVLAIGLFLFWGAFFLEHLREWFVHPAQGLPPVSVWLFQLAHLVMLIGLLVLLRWELLGSALTILGALAFFVPIGGSRLLLFVAVTSLPAVLALSGRLLQRHAVPAPGAQGPR
jgi:hypothetical protein